MSRRYDVEGRREEFGKRKVPWRVRGASRWEDSVVRVAWVVEGRPAWEEGRERTRAAWMGDRMRKEKAVRRCRRRIVCLGGRYVIDVWLEG